MKDSDKLKIYDRLRAMHGILNEVWAEFASQLQDDSQADCAFDAVDNVLYLAEGFFARMEP